MGIGAAVADAQDDATAKWWTRWWAEDWSWTGLAAKPVGKNGAVIHGGRHGERNLQDYWRRDPTNGVERDDAALEAVGELVRAPDGALWHLAHVPLAWRTGEPAKAGWAPHQKVRLADLIRARVADAAQTTFDRSCNPLQPDGRTQLRGVVLLAPPFGAEPKGTMLFLDCTAAWLTGWDAKVRAFAGGFRCSNANFSENCDFGTATFPGHARFDNATFVGDAVFVSAIFSGDASFDRATFSGNASFFRATFSRYVSFISATFSGDPSFDAATFSGDASFSRATFSGGVGFDAATFSGHASFNNAIFSGNASFVSATFSGYAFFDDATFSGNAGFNRTTFSEDASFDHAKFRRGADWEDAAFAGDARFADTTFGGFANFTDVAFDKSVTFELACLGRTSATAGESAGARFLRCQFSGPARFHSAQFPAFMDFTAANFARQAWFTEITWPAAAVDWHGAFDQAVFRDVASFRGSGFRAFAAFDGASFGGGLQLDDTDEAAANLAFRVELEAARPGPSENEQRLKELERGCRVLKQAMEKASHKTREQILFAFELRARCRQSGTPPSERFIAWAYDWVADYGRSIFRPLALLLPVTVLIFPFIYWWLAEVETWGAFGSALRYSFGRVFPFGAWTLTGSPWEIALLGKEETAWRLLARGVATVQSIMAVILVFLSLLAIRRRFQIN